MDGSDIRIVRFKTFAISVLTPALLAVPASADDPPKKLTAEERKELEAKWLELNEAGFKAYQAGKYSEAAKAWERDARHRLRNTLRRDCLSGHQTT